MGGAVEGRDVWQRLPPLAGSTVQSWLCYARGRDAPGLCGGCVACKRMYAQLTQLCASLLLRISCPSDETVQHRSALMLGQTCVRSMQCQSHITYSHQRCTLSLVEGD